MLLRDAVARLAELPDDAVLHAGRPWATTSPVEVVLEPAERPALPYLLEVDLAREAVLVWTQWRGGATPSVEQACQAVLHYAEHDAYLPVEGAG